MIWLEPSLVANVGSVDVEQVVLNAFTEGNAKRRRPVPAEEREHISRL